MVAGLWTRAVLVVWTTASMACSVTDGDVLRTRGPDGAAGDGGRALDGGDVCSADGPCPVPAAGTFTLCGRVHDLETTEPLSGVSGPGASLTLRIYDLAKLADRDDPPLATATLDACGWFVARDVDGVVTGRVAITTDDTSTLGSTFAWAGSILEVDPGQVGRTNAFALRTTTEAAWSTSAGVPTGTFSAGSLFAVYTDLNAPPVGPFQGAPVDGVAFTRNGLPLVGEDYYFSDDSMLERRTIASALESTGANGSGLMTGLALSTEASGSRSGCDFVDVTAMTLLPIVQVQEIRGTCN